MPIAAIPLQSSAFSPLSVAVLVVVIAAAVGLAVWLARLDDESFARPASWWDEDGEDQP